MSKLWSKGYELDALVEKFTVENDSIRDARLIPADILGSLAHAAMLESIARCHPIRPKLSVKVYNVSCKEHEEGKFHHQGFR